MANNGGIITAPISAIFDVPIVLGLGTYDIGEQIIKASVGGKDITLTNGSKIKSAFNIIETGSNAFDGTLIEGAKPYWNIFSNESPGAWEKTEGDDTPLIFRLKPFAGDITKGYGFNLDEFDGYNHKAIGPENNNITINVPVGTARLKNVAVKYKTGDYDWRKIYGVNAAQFNVFGTNVDAVSEVVTLTGTNVLLISNVAINLASTTSPHIETFTNRLRLCNKTSADFSIIGYIPIDSIITFNIYQPKTAAKLTVKYGESNTTFVINQSFTEYNNRFVFSGRLRISGSVKDITLKKIEYTLKGINDEVGKIVTISSGFNTITEGPVTYDFYDTDDVEFTVSRERNPATDDYPYLDIVMYY